MLETMDGVLVVERVRCLEQAATVAKSKFKLKVGERDIQGWSTGAARSSGGSEDRIDHVLLVVILSRSRGSTGFISMRRVKILSLSNASKIQLITFIFMDDVESKKLGGCLKF